MSIKEDLIGKDEFEAINILKENGFQYRVSSKNGHSFMLTQDFKPERYNLKIEENKVVDVYNG